MKRSALNVAWILLGVLTVSALLITLGENNSEADPRVDSYGPSGLSAFADLLRVNGYRVSSTSSAVPDLRKGDIAIACIDEEDIEPLDLKPTGVYARLSEFVSGGGRVVLLPFAPHFADASPLLTTVTATNPMLRVDEPVTIRQLWQGGTKATLSTDLPSATLWSAKGTKDNEISRLTRFGKGTFLNMWDGYMASNRFIDHDKNADVLMSSIRAIAPQGSHVVFTEAAFTNPSPGLIEALGPGATGIWYQAIFLFLVICYTLGKRFGLPEESRPIQTGQREFVDAIADTYRRAHSTRVACRSAYDRADQETRKAIRLTADAPASERDLRIPAPLALQFRRVFEGTIDSMHPADAFERCRALRKELREFLRR